MVGEIMIDYIDYGLSDSEVKERKEQGHINISHDNISKSKKQIFIEHTVTYFNFINLFLAGIIISTGHWKNLTFMVAVIVNAVIGIIQELKVKKVIDNLTVVTVKKVKVIRNHSLRTIPVEELVIDDVIYLENGDQIGSDSLVLESFGMEVNEAMLTGESLPIQKKKDDELLSGSFVVAGHGYAKVIRVGNDNYSTQLVHKAKHKNNASSEMKDAINKVIRILSLVIIPVGIVLFLAQISTTPYDRGTAIVKTVAGVVGMIPEGLVLLTSLSFIIGVGKLAKKNALIQEMEAIEALARVDVLCLDKTGTITTGDLSVENIYPFNHIKKDEIFKIMGIMAHCFEEVNSTQLALQNYFPKQEARIQKKIPFSSVRKMSAIALEDGNNYVLGAPEYLLDEEDLFLKYANDLADQGLRVLLIAKTTFIDEENMSIGLVDPIGLISIKDCMREHAKETLSFFDKSHVEIKILSGDNPATVSRIALRAGLKDGERYIDASTLPKDEDEFQKVVQYYRVFGRVKPEQKQRIIQALQNDQHVVGMVGDGVNDVLALKDADCGIAMANGSDAAKQAAHIVLLDSNFSSMTAIVEEGRTIISDIERVSSLYLTKTIYSSALCLIYAMLRLSYPFTPLQLSLISGLAIGIPSFLLTLERSSKLSSQGFLKHVISTALPCALTMIIYMLFISLLGHWLNFDAKMYSTYYFSVAGFISFLVVFVVCIPMNRLRLLICCLIALIFYLILLILPDFFGIYPLLSCKNIWIIPICISAIFVLGILSHYIRLIYKKRTKKTMF